MNENDTPADGINDVTKNPGVDYESQDLSVRWLTIFGGGLLLAIVVAMIFIAGLVWTFERRTSVGQDAGPAIEQPVPPAPRNLPGLVGQTPAQNQLQTLQSQEEFILNSYDWIDREAGIVRIPIDRAMELMVERYR
jgi:hypothetical protein